jgi:MerR family transcriptional regulator, thiopeptide resistance regulator
MDTWSVGELARQTGLTVRTLHHYDEIGLARPSQRTAAGHRRYTGDDVRRLHRIVALRAFGFTLTEVGALLDAAAPDPRELVRRQLDQATERIARTVRLRDRLETVLRVFDAAGNPSADVLVELIEGMTAVDAADFKQMAAQREAVMAKLTPEERAEMAARRAAFRESLTPEQLAELQRSRPPIPH